MLLLLQNYLEKSNSYFFIKRHPLTTEEEILNWGIKESGRIRFIESFDINESYQFVDVLITDFSSLMRAIDISKPNELHNLGAISFVGLSFKQPELTANVTGLGPLRLLEAIRTLGAEKEIKFYQASSSEMFGKVLQVPQNEATPFYPRSPYGVAKVYAHQICVNYRESYGMHASNGILFNHESPLRGETFVTRKITRAVAQIHLGLLDQMYLGNLDAQRDWGFAGDYIKAMWLMLQQDVADDYVIATQQTHTVREFLDVVFEEAGLDWHKHVVIDPKYFRPNEVPFLLGDPAKAKEKLGWQPKVDMKLLARMMYKSDMAELTKKLNVGITP